MDLIQQARFKRFPSPACILLFPSRQEQGAIFRAEQRGRLLTIHT